jgi:HD-like signal output (HDOD) protein
MSSPIDVHRLVRGIDALASQRPVAARVVAAADEYDASAKDLAAILTADVALAGRVMKLANSAFFGMRGRVASLQLAVTVVGFTSVRTLATVALTDLADESRVPRDFWAVSTGLALAAERLSPKFGMRPADALCLGLLSQLGSALLYQFDDAYRDLLAAESTFAGRHSEERKRYGLSAEELTAQALETWGSPASMTVALQRVDDPTSLAGGLLRACYEIVSRLTIPDHRPAPIGPLTKFQVREEDLPEILYAVRNETEDLRRLVIGEQADEERW